MHNYYHILGVTPNATLDQIKKAYRKKAMVLHPDINKADDAHEQFILLNEAYEYLLKTQGTHTNHYKRAQQQAQRQAEYQKEWEQKEREQARERAKAYAQMKYEAYLNSDIYKTTEALNLILDLFGLVFLLLFVFGIPVFTFLEHGIIGLAISAIIILPTAPIWFRLLIRFFVILNFKGIVDFKHSTIRSKMMKIMLFLILNIIILFAITLNTLIELKYIIAVYSVFITCGIIISRFFKSRYYKYLIKFGFAPFAINLLFLINYFIASNPTYETYWYSYSYHDPSPILPKITLENNRYDKYTGIRLIFDGEKIIGHGKITYLIKDGCLGFRVVKQTIIE
ncbi:J domain-containing protein [Plebeiibacterium sediminum]|uniref:DnaJ domain-containing protein n=1 Tax=Plebeiibacterium sediminum TaxID=2992112 RepID=A0AAE3SGS2_9BACT|nr:J domain-containing protein [Plebeiobacterium sediminum]MCW3788790.1 DnaJ domain-containing protein [Plebeiobacterium sediminum]